MTETTEQSLADKAYFRIKHRLSTLDLMPGDRLSEMDLVNILHISRTPIRQALQRLLHEGLLVLAPKSGWTVAPLDFDKIDQLYDFRTLIERYALTACCQYVGQQPLIDALEKVWLVTPDQYSTDIQYVSELDEQFHMALVSASGNLEMAKVHADITEKIRIVRRLDFTKSDRIEATYQEHQQILQLIAQRRVEQALIVLSAHIEISKIESRKITLDTIYRARREVDMKYVSKVATHIDL